MTSVEHPEVNAFRDHTRLSRLGLGAWAFGRTGWGVQRDHDSRKAILRAVELGVTWIDTAAVYGDGHSERLVGRTLSELDEVDQPLIFTKGGLRVDSASGKTFRDLRPQSLRHECEESLRRLRLERIDLYQLHWPTDDLAAVEAAWDTLGELQSEGKIRWTGVSNFDVPLLAKCALRRPVDSAQVPLSLLSREAGRELLPWAAEHGVQIFVYSPLASGLLSDDFSMQRLLSLPTSDWRPRREQFQRPHLDRTAELIKRLKPIATSLGASLTEMAVAWTLTWPAVSGAIVGARTAAQVDGWIGASALVLDDSALDAIGTALSAAGAGMGPAHPYDGGSETKRWVP